MTWPRLNAFLSLILVAIAAAAVNTAERVFDPRVASVKLSRADDFYSPPVITLGSGQRLILNFDILGYDRDFLQYRLIHCNADWQPSMLLDQEFASGFNSYEISDFAFSANTFQHYVNYRVEIPGENGEGPLVSGNYLLQVVQEADPSEVLFQIRFAVSEGKTRLSGKAHTNTAKGSFDKWQQLEVSAGSAAASELDPLAEYILIAQQNSGPFAGVSTIERASAINPSEIRFFHNNGLIFPAGNEFRRFETVNLSAPGLHVDSIRFRNGLRHVTLTPDRIYSSYAFDRTQYGKYMVRELNATDSNLGADYCNVTFTLKCPEFKGARVALDGEFASSLSPEQRIMTYDPETQSYTSTLLLKQGSYNYRYVLLSDDALSGPDGDFYPTSNQYTLYLFERKPGWRADKLIGTATFLSHK